MASEVTPEQIMNELDIADASIDSTFAALIYYGNAEVERRSAPRCKINSDIIKQIEQLKQVCSSPFTIGYDTALNKVLAILHAEIEQQASALQKTWRDGDADRQARAIKFLQDCDPDVDIRDIQYGPGVVHLRMADFAQSELVRINESR